MLGLCTDIFLVRELGELQLEQGYSPSHLPVPLT